MTILDYCRSYIFSWVQVTILCATQMYSVNYKKMIQKNVDNILIFLNLRLLQQNRQYSTKGGLYNVVKTSVTIHDKMVFT